MMAVRTKKQQDANGHTTAKPLAAGHAEKVLVKPLREGVGIFDLVGTAPLMQCKFSGTKFEKMREAQESGSTARSKKVREPRNYEADYLGAMHRFPDGGHGIPAAAFRAALISACRLVGYKMTIAKMSVFVQADGHDAIDSTPLVRFEGGEPEMSLMPARNANGSCDIRSRPLWKDWKLTLRVAFDLDQFTPNDLLNLLVRVGKQVGIGEGRPDSRNSAGLGYGIFDVRGARFEEREVAYEDLTSQPENAGGDN